MVVRAAWTKGMDGGGRTERAGGREIGVNRGEGVWMCWRQDISMYVRQRRQCP